ncbi:drug/sodium antiporter [[Clostridium] sordellii]|nr:drug/sodium antiporter, MATE family,Multidrug export protein mepA,multidrug efflux protein,MATE efflux family protein,MatE [[Clostridium] sordellii] [Paeniclostridium sordellii]CEO34971.1 drug/sodium antiporter [[Clostridium] sordellii] [Paeniclostridium sordellii]CEP83888.1 drug/sodium antiporter [[Clostridium] sordellii] [Paeniclostridium sordellii]CEP89659.1 drug/sodium antiporter [[Clostridium] sordellii] [Paeniclostridium sordellii]CEP93123.1 drug/sodium antiporter [[Clostridium] sordel
MKCGEILMKDLTVGKESKCIFNFALPMLIGSLFQQLYNTADSIIVGRFVGKSAMAAVSGANPIMFLLTSFLMGITLGFSILISQYYGSKNMEKVKSAIDTTYVFIFIASFFITFIGVFFSGKILEIMNTPSEIFDLSKGYLIIIFTGTLFSTGYNSICAILRGLGDSTNPLYFLIIATILNIILDIVFIIYFNMGVNGVALATIIAQAVAFIFSVLYLNRKHEVLKIKVRNLKYDLEIFKTGLKLGLPSAIQQTLFSIGNITLQSLVNSYGTSAMAAFGAGSKIETFISLPIMNLGSAVSTFVAQNIGANKVDRVKKGVKSSINMSLSISLFVIIIFFLFKENLIKLFNTDPEVVSIGCRYLLTIGPFFFLIGTSFMLTSAIRGAGASMFAMISSMISLWIARIPASYLLSSFYGVNGIWMGIPIGWCVGLIVTGIYYKNGYWKNKSVVNINSKNKINPEFASTKSD